MASLKIGTGMIELDIEDDFGNIRGKFRFNPNDIKSARKVMDLIEEFKVKQNEFSEKEKTCTDAESRIRLLDEIVDYMKKSIDDVWGEDSSKTLFGNASTLDMFDDFFNGITPFYLKESKKRTGKYKK